MSITEGSLRAGLAAFAKYGAIIVALDSNYPSREFIASVLARARALSGGGLEEGALAGPSKDPSCLAYLSASTLPPRLHLLPPLTRSFLRQPPFVPFSFHGLFFFSPRFPSFLEPRSLNAFRVRLRYFFPPPPCCFFPNDRFVVSVKPRSSSHFPGIQPISLCRRSGNRNTRFTRGATFADAYPVLEFVDE